jgi:hypothetical protein
MADDDMSTRSKLVLVRQGMQTCYIAEAVITTTSCVWVEFEQYSTTAAGKKFNTKVFWSVKMQAGARFGGKLHDKHEQSKQGCKPSYTNIFQFSETFQLPMET